MAQVVLDDAASKDLSRLVEFLLADDPVAALQTKDLISSALGILANHPFVGRPVELGFRELVISRGRSGYVALYDFLEEDDLVVVMSIRHQREAGFPRHE